MLTLAAADLLVGKHRISWPHYISSWNWPAAKESVAALAPYAAVASMPTGQEKQAAARDGRLRGLDVLSRGA